MAEHPEDSYGFSSVSTLKERIKQIRPAVSNGPPPDLTRIDAVADNAGFVSREPLVESDTTFRSQRFQKPEPRIPLNMRVPVSLGAAFQRFCEAERYSYPEALAEIMRRAGMPLK